MQEMEKKGIVVVEALYKALARGDRGVVERLVASDLDWWFHGPPQRHHMMRMLTGKAGHDEFSFQPRRVEMVGAYCVAAEGWEGAHAYWAHVWILKEGGDVITQIREYFNTWLIVQDLGPASESDEDCDNTLWQSQPRDLFDRSFPGVVLFV